MTTSARSAELDELRKAVRPEYIEGCAAHMVRLNIERTRLVRLVAILNLPDGYPNDTLAVELSSPTLPEPLLAKLVNACEKEAKALAAKPQLVAVVTRLLDLLDTNRLLPCYDELVVARALVCAPPPPDCGDAAAWAAANWLRPHEKSGRVQLRAQQGAYFLEAELLVPAGYPDAPPTIAIGATNFDERLRDICQNNASEIVRRMHEGFSAETALAHQGPPPGRAAKGAPPDLSSGGLRQLKHDREFLHAVAQVRGHDARRTRRVVEHAERKTMQQQAAERAAADAAIAAVDAQGERLPLRSVLATIRYVVERTVRELPTQLCPICQAPVLPADPALQRDALRRPGEAQGAARSAGAPKLEPIERSFCGHWFHAGCLEAKLTVPPFRLACAHPRCGKEVYHPKFSDRIDKLEKRWALEQAKTREISELAGMMNMTDDEAEG